MPAVPVAAVRTSGSSVQVTVPPVSASVLHEIGTSHLWLYYEEYFLSMLLGRDLSTLSDEQRTTFRGKNVGFMFQQFNLVPTLTALENVAIPMLLNGYSESDAYAQAAAFLDSLGV